MLGVEKVDIAMATELWETLEHMIPNAGREAEIAVVAGAIAAARGMGRAEGRREAIPPAGPAMPSADEAYRRGYVVRHCSEVDGGPDIGMSLGLGRGRALWVGEITRDAHAGAGEDAAALGDDTGWWLMTYPDRIALAKFVNAERAREFFALLVDAVL
jgi:hypothetical protein